MDPGITAELSQISASWNFEYESMTEGEKHTGDHGALIQTVFGAPCSTPPPDSPYQDCAVLRISGQLTRSPTGVTMFPTKEELNDAFAALANGQDADHSIRVEAVTLEDNFNFLHLDPTSHNHLLQVKEAYAVFGSAEQAVCVLRLKRPMTLRIASPVDGRNYQASIFFEPPAHKKATRTAYATIGTRLQLLRNVDTRLRVVGAVPSPEGMPVLPSSFMQTEQFDINANECIARDNREGLHRLLVSRVRVDRNWRQAVLDRLVDERIDILLRLCSYDLDEFPFAFVREFR